MAPTIENQTGFYMNSLARTDDNLPVLQSVIDIAIEYRFFPSIIW